MLERFKVPEADRVYVPVDSMRSATEAIFRAVGLTDVDAAQAADVLMTNDLRGVESHGVSNMLRSYVAGYREGRLTPQPEIVVEHETETTVRLDGGGGLGLHVAPHAMQRAIAKARERGIGSAGVHNVGHMGGTGYHAMLALDHDMIGIAMSSSGSLSMVPTFAAEPRLGTNPMAWAVPADEMPPFVFDIGTTQVAQNKMRLAQRVGAKIAPGWIADEHGTPVMVETDAPEKFSLLPLGATRELGSHKGYGFGTIVDIMCSVLVGLGPGFTAMTPGYHLMALRIDAFTDLSQFKRDMDALLEGLASTPPAPGEERVVYAGLLEAEDTKIRLAEGIPYHTEVIEWFRRVEAEMKLDFDFT
ncbi:MAG TPA: Ldh family oxidoreductase [Dehalococcoidia bacterium]|nr:Ldh family oxidoreductase [Dehalococcoidia bacterium]